MAFVVRIAASDQLCQTASLRWNFPSLSLSACVCLCRMLSVLCVWHLFFKWIFHHSPYPGGKFDLFKYFKTKYCCGMCLKHKLIDCNSQLSKRIAFQEVQTQILNYILPGIIDLQNYDCLLCLTSPSTSYLFFFSRKENIVFVIMAIEEALKTAHICTRSNFIFLRMNFNPFLTLHTSSNVTWFKHVSSESKEPSEAASMFCFFLFIFVFL